MVTRLPLARTSADACPGALRPHHAADGDLVRLRLPGGAVDPPALLALASASQQFADGRLGLTSRGNLQLRGVLAASTDQLAGRVRAAGLLPSLTHERVRNIVASPLSGRVPGSLASVDALVAELDAAVCRRPGLARLPGRFLFAVDDGSGDVAGAGADVLLQARGAGQFAVLLAGTHPGVLIREPDAVAAATAVAEAFLAERAAQGGTAWRLSELDDGPARVLARSGWGGADAGDGPAPGPELAPGLIEQTGGLFTVCALTPLGLITQQQAAAIAAAGALSNAPEHGPHGPLRITPWRRIVVRDLELAPALAVRELLDAAGLVTGPGTAWGRVTACAGRPGCAKALSDVHADARAFVARASPAGAALHWIGCERGCGTPSQPVSVAVATGSGYHLRDGDLLTATEQAWIGAR